MLQESTYSAENSLEMDTAPSYPSGTEYELLVQIVLPSYSAMGRAVLPGRSFGGACNISVVRLSSASERNPGSGINSGYSPRRECYSQGHLEELKSPWELWLLEIKVVEKPWSSGECIQLEDDGKAVGNIEDVCVGVLMLVAQVVARERALYIFFS